MRIIRIASKPLIVAPAVGEDLSPRRIDQTLQCAVVGFQTIVETFRLLVLHLFIHHTGSLERAYRLAASLVLIGVARLWRTFFAKPQGFRQKAPR